MYMYKNLLGSAIRIFLLMITTNIRVHVDIYGGRVD